MGGEGIETCIAMELLTGLKSLWIIFFNFNIEIILTRMKSSSTLKVEGLH